ncbi:hypothetical protein GH807_05295 [Acetobacterium tundrae]|uniref:Ig-like domain-containing protein n=2 Tax=Acetobacterium tundrae TaxID=132932 RepID=A0ABR6WJN6_9FIRM|nr:hypothetical protein [Acetobacterium tundrae]
MIALFLVIGVVPSSVSATSNPGVNYQTQIENIGWEVDAGIGLKSNGQDSGTSGKSLRLEGIKINLDAQGYDLGVSYQTHIQDIGWEADTGRGWKSNGVMSGTQGESKRLEAIQIKLTGADADKFDIYYQVHAQNIGWMGWAKNGESAGTAGYSYRLEAIKIQIVPKGADAPGTTANSFLSYGVNVDQKGFKTYENSYDGSIEAMLFCSFVNNTNTPVKITDINFSLTDANGIVLGTSPEYMVEYAPAIIMPGQRGFAYDQTYASHYKINTLDEPSNLNVIINTKAAVDKDMVGILNTSNAAIELGEDDYSSRVVCIVENPSSKTTEFNVVVAGLFDANNQLLGCMYNQSDYTMIGANEKARYSLNGWRPETNIFQNAVKAESAGRVDYYKD